MKNILILIVMAALSSMVAAQTKPKNLSAAKKACCVTKSVTAKKACCAIKKAEKKDCKTCGIKAKTTKN